MTTELTADWSAREAEEGEDGKKNDEAHLKVQTGKTDIQTFVCMGGGEELNGDQYFIYLFF